LALEGELAVGDIIHIKSHTSSAIKKRKARIDRVEVRLTARS
jgi:hypothetical protein